MPRTPSFAKKLGEIVRDFLDGVSSTKPADRRGKPPIAVGSSKRNYDSGRYRAETPTRDQRRFQFFFDILANSPAINRSIAKLAQDAALDERGQARSWSIDVEVTTDPDAEEQKTAAKTLKRTLVNIGNDWADRTGIGYNTKHYINKSVSMADCFAEQHIVLDTATGLGFVKKIREVPTGQMRVVQDEDGDVIAYEQHRSNRDKFPIRWNIPAQIIHFKNRPCDYFPYGVSDLEQFWSRWENYKLLELDFFISAHIKSNQPEIHYLGLKDSREETPREKLDQYKQELLDNPADIQRYYVVDRNYKQIEFPKTGDSESVKNLLEVRRELIEEFVLAIGIPGHLSGNAKDIAGRHLSNSIDADYARRIQSIRQDFTYFLYPALLLEYALHGYNFNLSEEDTLKKYGVRRIRPVITWPDMSESRTAKSKRTVMELLAGKTSWKQALREDGCQDPDALIQETLEEIKDEIHPIVLLAKIGQQFAPKPVISNNEEKGKGVPTDSREPENEKQASVQMSLFDAMFKEDTIREAVFEWMEENRDSLKGN